MSLGTNATEAAIGLLFDAQAPDAPPTMHAVRATVEALPAVQRTFVVHHTLDAVLRIFGDAMSPEGAAGLRTLLAAVAVEHAAHLEGPGAG